LATFAVKENKIVAGFNQKQQHILFYLEDVFRSIGHHQTFFIKLGKRITCSANNVLVIRDHIIFRNVFKYVKNIIKQMAIYVHIF